MDFFKAFPYVRYTFNGTSVNLTHILKRFGFVDSIKNAITEWDYYIINDKETPDMVSYNFYGNSNYHWLILLFNDIIDPVTDWPMDMETLLEYANLKYDDINGTHHYQKNNRLVPSNVAGAELVTNIEYEIMLNEAKRKIKIPKETHLKPILNELETILSETK